MNLINNLRQEGITVLMITHDMRLVDSHIERAIVMANGQKVFDGSPNDLFQSPEILERASLRTTILRRLVDDLCGPAAWWSRLGSTPWTNSLEPCDERTFPALYR
jgi:energy-coupling factor transport system ATP-binding protein